jgi:uncharacterized peroxidase-related enzyme
MSRLPLNHQPHPKAAAALEGIQKSIGMLPNIHKLMAHSPAVLEGYLAFSAALGKGSLSAQDREQISLAVAGYDRCEYCASAHTLLAKKAGVSEAEATDNLHGKSGDARMSTLISFCLSMLKNKGFVSDDEMKSLRQAGFTDEQIVEIVAIVCMNIFTNYFNHVAGTDLDFPKVKLP